jgi:hypothetical protein
LEDAPSWILSDARENGAIERELFGDIFVGHQRGVGRGEHRGEALR